MCLCLQTTVLTAMQFSRVSRRWLQAAIRNYRKRFLPYFTASTCSYSAFLEVCSPTANCSSTTLSLCDNLLWRVRGYRPFASRPCISDTWPCECSHDTFSRFVDFTNYTTLNSRPTNVVNSTNWREAPTNANGLLMLPCVRDWDVQVNGSKQHGDLSSLIIDVVGLRGLATEIYISD